MCLANQLNQIEENRIVEGWIRSFNKDPLQMNEPHEADAELITLPGTNQLIALSIDTISEEIGLGFYQDSYTIGWMAATVTLSDLAAVGARPAGLLISVTLPDNTSPDYQLGIARGINDASCRVGTHVIGGDTNFGATASITTSGIGFVDRHRVLNRIGCQPSDKLYATGRLGSGGLVAAKALWETECDSYGKAFRPLARLTESQLIRDHASACMDSSDGLIATLDQLGRLNQVGFELDQPIDEILDPDAQQFCSALDLDPLLMLAQPHGEFELLFTIPAGEQETFEQHAKQQNIGFLLLGKVISKPMIHLSNPGPRTIDSGRIRNLLHEVDGNLQRYIKELMSILEGAYNDMAAD